MPRGVILVDYTNQGRRTIKDSPDRAEAAKAEAAKLGVQVKDIFYTPGGPHDRAIIVEAEGLEPINKFRSRIQSLGNVLLCTGTYSALSIPYSIWTRKSERG